MKVLNNRLLYVIFIILIMNNAYGQHGGNGGGTKEQTDLVLNVSYNKSSGYDGDNITIQYILSNVGTKTNQEALNIIILENIPSYFVKPSRKLQVSNDRLTDSDPQNNNIALNTSKVEEASEYKLLLDTNGCLIINCSKLNPNNNITIYYSTYINYTGNENTNSFSSGNLRTDFDNVRDYLELRNTFTPMTRPIVIHTQYMFRADDKYYILNNSEINITYHSKNTINKNNLYIYKTKNENNFTELASTNRITKSGEFYFGIKLDGESPKYNQSIFIVEDLVTYHTSVFKLLICFTIAFASIFLYLLVFIYLEPEKKLTRLIMKVVVLSILLGLTRSLLISIPQLYFYDVIWWVLGTALTSYVIFIKAPNVNILKIDALKSSSSKKILCILPAAFFMSFVFTILYLLLPNITAPLPSIPAFIQIFYGIQGIGLQILIYASLLIVISYLYNSIKKTEIVKKHKWMPGYLKKISVIGYISLILWLANLKTSFEYPISNDTKYYIILSAMSVTIIIGLWLTDEDGLQEARKIIPKIKECINSLLNDGKAPISDV
jgi:hypothetical protein